MQEVFEGYIHGVGVDEYRLPPLPEEDDDDDEVYVDGVELVLLGPTEETDNTQLKITMLAIHRETC